jgi:hypothetical protein
MSIQTTPYTYLIGWSIHNKWYYGVRYAKGCNPSDLWATYFTSSKYVYDFRERYGDPDIIQIRRTFTDSKSARLWEKKVIIKLDVIHKNMWLNEHNGIAPNPQTISNFWKNEDNNKLHWTKSIEGRKFLSNRAKWVARKELLYFQSDEGKIDSSKRMKENCPSKKQENRDKQSKKMKELAEIGVLPIHTKEAKEKCAKINRERLLGKENMSARERCKSNNPPRKGTSTSEQARKNMSESKKLNPSRYWLGKSRDEETKKKISKTKKAGLPQTEEHKKKNSEAISLLWKDPLWREKTITAMRKTKESKNANLSF